MVAAWCSGARIACQTMGLHSMSDHGAQGSAQARSDIWTPTHVHVRRTPRKDTDPCGHRPKIIRHGPPCSLFTPCVAGRGLSLGFWFSGVMAVDVYLRFSVMTLVLSLLLSVSPHYNTEESEREQGTNRWPKPRSAGTQYEYDSLYRGWIRAL